MRNYWGKKQWTVEGKGREGKSVVVRGSGKMKSRQRKCAVCACPLCKQAANRRQSTTTLTVTICHTHHSWALVEAALAEVGGGSDALMCNELTFQHIYTRSIEWPRPCGECHAPFGGSTNACGSKVEEQNGAYNEALTLSIVAALATVFANERKLKTDLASG